jgi:cytochrome c oxidase subunit 3
LSELAYPHSGGPPAHSPGLDHQFESYEQQRESASLGMWAFIVQEVMFFGGLFATYMVYRQQYPDAFAAASHSLDIKLGAFNTAVLIASSLTMALAVRAAQLGRRKALMGFLAATAILGTVFLGVKVVEYKDKFEHHHVPGPAFHFEETERHGVLIDQRHAQMFFGLYFAMTGLHALHMVIGIAILLWLLYWARRGRFTPENHNYVEGTGLYWHFVDIVWIFLFPMLYLIGRH